jgi:hypothetical protein
VTASWSGQGQAVEFSIAPAFYQTNWFRASLAAIFVARQQGPFEPINAAVSLTSRAEKVRSREYLAVAVGIPIARHPPHKTVRALLRIRLPPWIFGVKVCNRIRVQDARGRNPSVKKRFEPLWITGPGSGFDLDSGAEDRGRKANHSSPRRTSSPLFQRTTRW